MALGKEEQPQQQKTQEGKKIIKQPAHNPSDFENQGDVS